jgi:hypothetical protein
MLGEEDAALSFDGPCPFSDVAAGKPSAYTGYAFAQVTLHSHTRKATDVTECRTK